MEHVTDQMLFMVDAYSFENLFDEKCRKAVRYIRQAGGKMKHSQLLRNMHESKEVFKQIMDTLQENGTVTTAFIPTEGKTAKYYRLA